MSVSSRLQYIWTHYKRDILLVLLVLVVAAVPRLVDLGTFLTADEKNWIGRSYEFMRALKDFRFNDMLQTTHPGVTAMYLSGASITTKMFMAHIPFSFENLFHFVKAAQMPIALVNALAVPIMYIFLRILFTGKSKMSVVKSQILAAIAALFIALDPFFIGYSRVAHVDALLASLLFLACLAIIIYVQKGYSRTWLIISSLLAAASVLTKAPAIFVFPFFWLAVLVQEQKGLFNLRTLNSRIRDFVVWTLIMGIVVVVVFPALVWVPNPAGNANLFRRDLSIAAGTPHHMAEDYTLNPWHYPAALLARTNPVTLIFSSIAILWLIIDAIKRIKSDNNPSSLAPRSSYLLIAYIFFFILMMTLGAKKGDRYILPVWPAIDVLAAVGLITSAHLISKIWKLEIRKWKLNIYKLQPTTYNLIISALTFLSIGYVSYVVWTYHPYTIAYSNPLFRENLSQELGWGEGLEQVGAWLSTNHPRAVVASWYPEELAAYTSAQVAHINAHEQPQVEFIVLYKNMFGRAPDHYANDFIDEYYKKREPIYTAYVKGNPYAWVYEKKAYERVIGEMTPIVRVGQGVAVGKHPLAGIELMVANYNGRATQGEFIVKLSESLNGEAIHQWSVPVTELEDNRWLELRLPQPLMNPTQTLFVEAFAQGTQEGNAPTIRTTLEKDYRPGNLYYSDSGFLTTNDERSGDLALRVLYYLNGQLVAEEETKLLEEGN